MKRYRKYLQLALTLLSAFIVTHIVSDLSAQSQAPFYTGARWPNGTANILFQTASDLNSELRIVSSDQYLNDAAAWWNMASRVNLARGSTNNVIATLNFSSSNPCGGLPQDAYALTCVTASPTTISRTTMWFNLDRNYVQFYTDGRINESSTPAQMDFFKVALHEFGHWYFLDDLERGNPNAVMASSWGTQPGEDDKHGATMLYGHMGGLRPGMRMASRTDYSAIGETMSGITQIVTSLRASAYTRSQLKVALGLR